MSFDEHMYIFLWGICPGVELIDHNGSVVKNPPVNAGDMGLIPGLGRPPGVGNVNPLQYFTWEIPWTGEPGGLPSMGLQKS